MEFAMGDVVVELEAHRGLRIAGRFGLMTGRADRHVVIDLALPGDGALPPGLVVWIGHHGIPVGRVQGQLIGRENVLVEGIDARNFTRRQKAVAALASVGISAPGQRQKQNRESLQVLHDDRRSTQLP